MHVKISYTVDVDDFFRRAISHHIGKTHKATRKEIKQHFEAYGNSVNDDLVFEYSRAEEEREETGNAHDPHHGE